MDINKSAKSRTSCVRVEKRLRPVGAARANGIEEKVWFYCAAVLIAGLFFSIMAGLMIKPLYTKSAAEIKRDNGGKDVSPGL